MAIEATYKTRNGRLMVKLSCDTVKALFVEIAQVAEILDADEKCGKCGSPDITPRVRTVKSFTYHELACGKCHATLSFGQNKPDKGGGLFPKRQDDNDNWLPNGGWSVYRKPGDSDEQSEHHERPGQPEPQRRTQSNTGSRAW
jgi:hypothetical protein